VLASLLANGEAQPPQGKPVALMGNVLKRRQEPSGVWRRNDRKAVYVKQGDLCGDKNGVHARCAEEPAAQESERP